MLETISNKQSIKRLGIIQTYLDLCVLGKEAKEMMADNNWASWLIFNPMLSIYSYSYPYFYLYLDLCILGNEAKEMMDDNNWASWLMNQLPPFAELASAIDSQ